MNKVYIVIGRYHDYEYYDHDTAPIKVFSSQEPAQSFCDFLNKEIEIYNNRSEGIVFKDRITGMSDLFIELFTGPKSVVIGGIPIGGLRVVKMEVHE